MIWVRQIAPKPLYFEKMYSRLPFIIMLPALWHLCLEDENTELQTTTYLLFLNVYTGVSREKDVFEINITPLIFSVEFIYYHEMGTSNYT